MKHEVRGQRSKVKSQKFFVFVLCSLCLCGSSSLAQTGSLEFGYRGQPQLAGNRAAYRSIVNLGEGPKLFSGTLLFEPRKFADRLEFHATGWGGEPHNAAGMEMSRDGVYTLKVNYRRLDYFNNLLTFQNPLLGLGSTLSQNLRDTERRLFDVDLQVFPGRRFAPFFSWSRDNGSGPGLVAFVASGNEYLSNTLYDDALDTYRGGAHLNFSNLNFTLEAGGTQFRDDQRVFYAGDPNPGNRRTPLLGNNQFTTLLSQRYRTTGDSFFTRVFGNWRPASFVDLAGQFSFSQPSVNLAYQDSITGLMVRGSLVHTGSTGTAAGRALQPHPSGNVAVEVRPVSRVRLLSSWHTDRFHIASSAFYTQTLNTGASFPLATNGRFFSTEWNRYQGEAIVELHPRLTLRGGYRRVWADASVPPSVLSTTLLQQRAKEEQQVGLAGLEVRVRKDLSVNLEGEASAGDSAAFFRTGFLDYARFKVRGRYRPRPSLSVTASFSWLSNDNPATTVDNRLRNRQAAVSMLLAPREGKRFTITLDYMHALLESDLRVLLPPFFDAARSPFAQDAHTAGAWLNLALVKGARLNVGGSLLVSDGTHPTRFYQPRAELVIPLREKLGWTTEWRWYGYRQESAPAREDFRSHLLAVGLRWTL
jgi:hypothetical protein